MAFVSGTAASMADLVGAIQAACTANGWTLSGQVLHSGNCYTQIAVNASLNTMIDVLGGTGIDVNNALTGAGPDTVELCAPLTSDPLIFPIAYYMHVYPEDVYCVINWNVSSYSMLGFGCSPVPGLPGTGGWYSATHSGGPIGTLNWAGLSNYYQGSPVNYNGFDGVGLFWTPGYATGANSYIHHGLDGGGWSSNAGSNSAAPDASAKSTGTAGPMLWSQPNTWNGESALVPVQPYITRGGGMMSITGDLVYARYVNMTNYDPQAIITLGSDNWKLYPFYKKGTTLAPNASNTGYLGVALKYDGP